jgi:hypothetical protein
MSRLDPNSALQKRMEMAVILDLAPSAFEMIKVTADFSNAVLVAVMPYISGVADKLDLPVPRPVAVQNVVHCSIKPLREWGVEIGINGGWVFTFEHGYVNTIQGPRYFFGIQNFDRIPDFFGEVKMTKTEAIQLARDSIKNLGISLESVFAEQEPRVTGPVKNGTNTIPHYLIEWLDPRGVGQAPACVEVDIDGQRKQVHRIRFLTKSLWRPQPRISVVAERDPRSPVLPRVNPEYAWRLIPFVLDAVHKYSRKLGLPIPQPLTTNHVVRLALRENLGGPYCELELTNGWRFLYEGSMVTAFYVPDNLFHSENRTIRVEDFVGKWRMTEAQAKELVYTTVAKLKCPTNLVHFEVAPQVNKPAMPGIPRYMFRWNYSPEGYDVVQSAISAEVDADKGEVKSLYYGDLSLTSRGPNIDVPILLPAPAYTNAPLQKGASRRKEKSDQREFPKLLIK